MPEDSCMYAKLREAGFEFRKQRAVVNYRRHEAQRSRSHCTEFCGASYFEANGLGHQVVTLFLPLSGRLDCWQRMSAFLDSQDWPHDQLRILCWSARCTPSQTSRARLPDVDGQLDPAEVFLIPMDRDKGCLFQDPGEIAWRPSIVNRWKEFG